MSKSPSCFDSGTEGLTNSDSETGAVPSFDSKVEATEVWGSFNSEIEFLHALMNIEA